MANEKRLIYADRLKAEFPYTGRFGKDLWDVTEIWKAIDNASPVDAEEVVRCKDCKKMFDKPNGSHYCKRTLQYAPSDGFCSYGERKDP